MDSSDRKLQEREMRKNRILLGALEVFKESGLEGATMDEIAQNLGLEKRHCTITLTQKKMSSQRLSKMDG